MPRKHGYLIRVTEENHKRISDEAQRRSRAIGGARVHLSAIVAEALAATPWFKTGRFTGSPAEDRQQ